MDDHISDLDLNSLTLDQAKQEILRLAEFKKSTFDFLYRLCGYEIREPMLSILSRQMAREFMDTDKLNPNEMLERAEFAGEDIMRIIELVSTLARNERNPHNIGHYYPSPQKADLDQILNTCILQAQKRIDYDNKKRAQLLEWEKSGGRIKVMQAREPIVFTTKIPKDLPPVNTDAEVIQRVLIDLTWLMTSHHLKTKIEFHVQFDDHLVHVTISCWSFYTRDTDLEDYRQFETTPTFLMFSSSSLVLFHSWKVIKEYSGHMKFDIEKSNASGEAPDRTFVTVALPRYDELK